jgi:hypothetical protein
LEPVGTRGGPLKSGACYALHATHCHSDRFTEAASTKVARTCSLFLRCFAARLHVLRTSRTQLVFEQLRVTLPLQLDKEIVESLTHEVFNIAIKIKGELLDGPMSFFAEVANEGLLPDASRLDVASHAIAAVTACGSRARI